MKKLEIKPDGFACKLRECPPGFFLFNGELCLKGNYQDYYCSDGNFFLGGTNNIVEWSGE